MKPDQSQAAIYQLLSYFSAFIPLSRVEKDLLVSKVQWKRFRKHQFVLQEGDVCRQINFVISGCLRTYKIDEQGNIHILQFAIENSWINDLGSFHSFVPSTLNIDALEDTEVLQISYENLISLYTEAPKFDKVFRVLIENAYIGLQKRLLLNISSTAEERFRSFSETYPNLTNRLSQVQIAAYLGVSPEFLSRLRSKAAKSSSPKP